MPFLTVYFQNFDKKACTLKRCTVKTAHFQKTDKKRQKVKKAKSKKGIYIFFSKLKKVDSWRNLFEDENAAKVKSGKNIGIYYFEPQNLRHSNNLFQAFKGNSKSDISENRPNCKTTANGEYLYDLHIFVSEFDSGNIVHTTCFFFAPSTSKFRQKKAEMQKNKKQKCKKKAKMQKKKQKMHVRFQN